MKVNEIAIVAKQKEKCCALISVDVEKCLEFVIVRENHEGIGQERHKSLSEANKWRLLSQPGAENKRLQNSHAGKHSTEIGSKVTLEFILRSNLKFEGRKCHKYYRTC